MVSVLRRAAGALLAALTLAGCGALAGPRAAPLATPAGPRLDPREIQRAVLAEVDEAIRQEYLFADYGGLDWPAEVRALEAQVEAGLETEAFYEALQGLLDRLPEGTVAFETRQERVEAELGAVSIYEGIGAFVAFRAEPEPHLVLLSVIPNSPAAEAGLEAHDSIYAVDGVPVLAEEGLGVVERVRGPEGTQVVLEVASPGGERRQVTVTRGRLTATDVPRGGQLDTGVLYYQFPVRADTTTAETLLTALGALAERDGAPGLILDLRISHGSPDWPLEVLLRAFADGELGAYVTRQGEQPLRVRGEDFAGSQRLPLAVLVGPDTTGTPEVFAAALQAVGRARLFGLPTPGAVLGFNVRLLPDGARLTYAVSTFRTASGLDLSQTGVMPDEVIEADWDEVKLPDDPVIEAAEAWILEQAGE